jgi:UDP-N-acetylmuramoylalanine--D-glutamate ligase
MIDKNKLKFLQNKKIAMLGLGVENLALVKFLIRQAKTTASRTPAFGHPSPSTTLRTGREGNIHITICDPKSAAELGDRFLEIKELARKNKLPEINLISGKNYDAHLADFDIIFRSPGSLLLNPNIVKAKKAGVEISSAMKLFFDLCPTKNIVGVTGSKGKGTTSSLIYEIIKEHLTGHNTPRRGKAPRHPSQEGISQRVFLGGNIGTAPFEFIDKIKPNDFVVLELSSFQLEDLEVSPHIAVVTNLFQEHLAPADPNNPNYHKSMKAYWAAKANIFAHQKKNNWLVINESLKSHVIPVKTGIQLNHASLAFLDSRLRGNDKYRGNDVNGKVIFYRKSELISNLIGEHNKENIAAAVAVAKILKIKAEIIKKAVKKFQGLPHRTEFVAEINGVKYFDDSFATVPDVSVVALKSFPGKKNIILLAGGADKGSDFKNFAQEIEKRVKHLILFKGKGTDRLKKQISNFQFPISIVDNMKKAIAIAKSKAKTGDVVLLSTGCASFGCFKNYKDRGEQFKKEVKNLK